MMRNFKSFMMLAAIAAASFSFTSCDDDDPWRGPNYWDNGGWRHDDNSQEDSRVVEANLLSGDWVGTVKLQELDENGNTNKYEFDANMIFYQDRKNAITGSGVEIDQATDENGLPVSQTLKFTWSIADNNNIYIKYNSGSTYLLDANASEDGYGFHLGPEKGYNNDTFFGYMIGTGSVKGDLMYIDLERNTSSSARVKSRGVDSTSVVSSQAFGSAKSRKSIAGATSKGLPARR